MDRGNIKLTCGRARDARLPALGAVSRKSRARVGIRSVEQAVEHHRQECGLQCRLYEVT